MPIEDKSTPAATSVISLSEAILAPLDAIFKAQIHSSRAFINYLFQMSYPHLPLKNDGSVDMDKVTDDMKKPYTLDLPIVQPDGETVSTIKIPSLALLPVTALGIDEADINFSLSVERIESHNVIQQSERVKTDEEGKDWDRTKRPWFLVDDPKSIKGVFKANDESNSKNSGMIEVSIKVRKQPLPLALEKSLSALTQTIKT